MRVARHLNTLINNHARPPIIPRDVFLLSRSRSVCVLVCFFNSLTHTHTHTRSLSLSLSLAFTLCPLSTLCGTATATHTQPNPIACLIKILCLCARAPPGIRASGCPFFMRASIDSLLASNGLPVKRVNKRNKGENLAFKRHNPNDFRPMRQIGEA